MPILAVDQAGIVRCAYNDDIARVLKEIGALDVQRASNVEFDNIAQGWRVFMIENKNLGIESFNVGPFQKREDALRWETRYVEGRLSGLSDSEACRIASKEES